MNTAYLPFARKWRPQNFDELVGQAHIGQILKNAVKQKRVANAYLFSGPRGVGKTSTARILAKALNCEKGPTPTPCNACTNCLEITASRSLDVIEIDGASNRGIDEIRSLRENVKFAPVQSNYKIYIIDEVHMLTQEAFNALLKTLEEPPGHITFIFATTQPHKVLTTIRSRCQRFDFERLPVAAIASKLETVIQKEKLTVAPEVPHAIARAADGSMRDAEVILDQLASFAKKKITLDDISLLLGLVSQESVMEAASSIINKDPEKALTIIHALIKEGKDLAQFVDGLLQLFRDMLIMKTVAKPGQLIQQPEEVIQELARVIKPLSKEEIMYIFNHLTNAKELMKRSHAPRLLIETAVIKLSQRTSMKSLDEILRKVEGLEKKLRAGTHAVSTASQKPLPQKESAPREKPLYKDRVVDARSSVDATAEEPSRADEPDAGLTGETHCNIEQIKGQWALVVSTLKKEKMSLGTYLSEGRIVGLEGRSLILGFQKAHTFHMETLAEKETKHKIEKLAREITGCPLLIQFRLIETEGVAGQEGAREDLGNDPVINSAIEIFGGTIVEYD
ncbi:MAG: DNA polymerase III subunit gamma/tau [Candidatus Omnitrophica bacterium]|nr:DNA polymerase III subunit gamma/tau [Candidatus Omnitrophota bacterium]